MGIADALKLGKREFLPTTLVGRVLSIYSLTWLMCVGLGGTMFFYTEISERVNYIQGQSGMVVELAAQVFRESAVIGDYDTMQRVLDNTTSNSIFDRTQYIDLSGGQLTSRSASVGDRGKISLWIESYVQGRLPPVNRTVSVGGTDYGILRFHYEAQTLSHSLQDFAYVTLLISLTCFSFGILFIWLPLRRWTRPLSKRRQGSENLAQIAITPELLKSAPAEFHAVLQDIIAIASQLRAELDQKESALKALLRLTKRLSEDSPDATSNSPAATESIENVIATISSLVEERAATNTALVHAKIAAEQSSRAKTAFVAAISHDIRTPMNGILAMANVLDSEESLNERQRAIAGTIFRSAKSLLTLLNDVLDISQIESEKMEIYAVDFDVDELIEDCVATFQQSAGDKNVNLRVTSKTGAGFCSDASRVRQMVSNLVSNAIKFTPGGSVEVSAGVMACQGEPRILTVIVKDDGPGISAEQQKKLFLPFSQLEEVRHREHGSGLGLSIVHKLAVLMGGEPGLISAVGEGSTFFVHLPCLAPPAAQPNDASAMEIDSGTASTGGDAEILRGKRVFVVDDTPSNLFVLDVLLKKLGCDSLTFETAREALQALEENQSCDAVLMDLQMPDMDGIAATKALRHWEHEQGKRPIPVLAVTAAAYTTDREACTAAGMNGFLTKPIMLGPLRESLKQLFSTGHA